MNVIDRQINKSNRGKYFGGCKLHIMHFNMQLVLNHLSVIAVSVYTQDGSGYVDQVSYHTSVAHDIGNFG